MRFFVLPIAVLSALILITACGGNRPETAGPDTAEPSRGDESTEYGGVEEWSAPASEETENEADEESNAPEESYEEEADEEMDVGDDPEEGDSEEGEGPSYDEGDDW